MFLLIPWFTLVSVFLSTNNEIKKRHPTIEDQFKWTSKSDVFFLPNTANLYFQITIRMLLFEVVLIVPLSNYSL